ncbi:MAG: aspartate/glutamate racemase family protein [Oscillospiraceae bacterium]
MKKVAFFHTTLNTPVQMKEEFTKRYPGVQLITMVEDGVLPEIVANQNEHTPGLVKRLIEYGAMAQSMGACVIVDMCTTLGIAVREAQKALEIPFITIDGPMLKQAVMTGKRVALLVTAQTTLKASSAAAYATARDCGRDVVIDTILVEGAFDALNVEHDKEKHNLIIANAVREAAQTHDVVALGQVTMADSAALCGDVTVPVLTSIKPGIEQLEQYLK